MKVLAVDTSSIVATCAILDENKLIGEYILNHKKTHSQKLMPIVKEIMESCELKPEDIDIFAASVGPGSFTGLRIGVATIKSLAQIMDKPVVGISALEALAFNVPLAEGLVVPLIDARRENVYSAIYKWDLGKLTKIEDERVIKLEELLNTLNNRDERIIFNGDGATAYKEKIINCLGNKAIFAPKAVNMPRASSVAELAFMKAKNGEVQHYLELVPNYIKKSQAQREYEKRVKVCGKKDA
ncbi:tRNA (adenosine(37)-N6)-threonylcarbamoyltransferase complex dimerization subunit type 1 TsaB [Thermohalobacter berrensis]|uniref:tRNA N6-adenosine(37)-N6-threonylcarbamoyltransferase complex dimerization subunit TsaB n=1 Tax=Thermohalobacter berrensis TaxID=99594 RepID=A0A419T4E5_9FIRM|nr:tRNA (adenosine(37)-N6)-threonylcarbamoyltransferase complex dimerization subunit type 1 TsaB [Thermohalobacter berrensis]RKD32351.1 tRNA N6-adenosine(37)-N6-threonylcarbamoyltransferase complex dimerization subunit TsaB [Thermohalobacter berrensis]